MVGLVRKTPKPLEQLKNTEKKGHAYAWPFSFVDGFSPTRERVKPSPPDAWNNPRARAITPKVQGILAWKASARWFQRVDILN
jgi:hypothetical protein